MNSILVNRVLLIHQLNVDKDEFQSLLERANVEDADSFTEEEVRKVKGAYVSQNANSRSRPIASARSLPTSAPASVGESQPTGTSQIAGGFVDVYIQHLEEEKNRVEAGMTAALSSYEQWLTDRSLQFFQQANEMRSSVFIQAAQNPLQGYTPRTIAALADNVGESI
jgi:hypothetical protein